jgi:hypothetical protein
MNNLPENENIVSSEETFSTIFSDPTEHKKVAAPKKNRLKIGISLFLALAILIGGTFAVVKLIPEKVEQEASSEIEQIVVTEYDSAKVEKFTVKNKNGKFNFNSKIEKIAATEDTEATEEAVWYMKGYDKTHTDSTVILEKLEKLVDITAVRELSDKSLKDCGLDKPNIEAVITVEGKDITVSIGDNSPDNVGTYLKVSTSDKIYIVGEEVASALTFTDLDLASTEAEAPLVLPKKYKDYYSEGTLVYFDSITLSGKNLPEKLVFIQNDNEDLAGYIPYYLTKPVKRVAENATGLFSAFSTGFYISGAYAYDVSNETLKSLGLNDPDCVLSIKFDDYTYTYKFKQQSDGNYAYIGNNSTFVRKVTLEDCAFLEFTTTDFYNKGVFLTPITGVKNLTFIKDGKTYSFDITENPNEDSEDQFIIKCDGKTYNSSDFQSFYQHLCMLELSDFDTVKTTEKAEFSMIYTYIDKKATATKIDFVKVSASKYQCLIDGVPMGKINATRYNKTLKLLDRLLEGKSITVN